MLYFKLFFYIYRKLIPSIKMLAWRNSLEKTHQCFHCHSLTHHSFDICNIFHFRIQFSLLLSLSFYSFLTLLQNLKCLRFIHIWTNIHPFVIIITFWSLCSTAIFREFRTEECFLFFLLIAHSVSIRLELTTQNCYLIKSWTNVLIHSAIVL